MKLRIIAITILMVFSQAFAASRGPASMQPKYKIKWVLAHEPVELFLTAAKVFSEAVVAQTNGEIGVEILTLKEYSKKYQKGKNFSPSEIAQLVRNGDIEMSQTYTTTLAKFYTPLYVLDLPFLFRDHGHATSVLEGKIGKNLLDGLSLADLKGLAFTYSGGYRIIPGRKAVESLSDFNGLSISTSTSPIARDVFTLLGAFPSVGSPYAEFTGLFVDKTIDLAELTYARYELIQKSFLATDAKFINETNHSLFLTSIIMNQSLWNKLSEANKVIIQNAANTAATLERTQSIEANNKSVSSLQNAGFKIVKMKDSEIERFKNNMKPIYEKYSRFLGKELVQSIIDQQ